MLRRRGTGRLITEGKFQWHFTAVSLYSYVWIHFGFSPLKTSSVLLFAGMSMDTKDVSGYAQAPLQGVTVTRGYAVNMHHAQSVSGGVFAPMVVPYPLSTLLSPETVRKTTWECEQCGKTFTNPRNKKYHMEGVHGDASYTCVCGKEYRYVRALYRHQKTCRLVNLNLDANPSAM